jgi:DNA-directed RNA polymerase subunit N (RpoN/RPB10)
MTAETVFCTSCGAVVGQSWKLDAEAQVIL